MDPWSKAVVEYKKGLNEDEKYLFETSNAKDILDEVRLAEQAHGKASRGKALARRVQPLLATVEQYGKALDVVANSNSLVSSIWGSLRILLRIAQEYQKYYEKVVEMLEHIGDVLPRYGTYYLLFDKHEPLQKALYSAYLEIIIFCTNARRLFTKSTFRHFAELLWRPFDEEFGGTLSQFRRYRQLVEDEARLAFMVESKQHIDESKYERAIMAEERELAAESRKILHNISVATNERERSESMSSIKMWIDGRLCTTEQEALEDSRLPGTCEWILQREELSKWRNDTYTRVLWLHGKPGSGKSFAYSRLLSYLDEQLSPTIYFYFSADDHERNKTTSLVRSWLLQILERYPNTSSIFFSYMKGSEHRIASGKAIYELFLSLLNDIPPLHLTADGLDECADKEQFFRLLPRIVGRHKVLISSRESLDIRNAILQRSAQLEKLSIEPNCTKEDIDMYISYRITTEFTIVEGETKKKILDRLGEGQGMFLWVRLMLDHLLTQTTVEEILDSLDKLPVGLDSTYRNILQAINSLPGARRLLANKILLWVTFARRPLRITELRSLLALQPGDQVLDEKRFVLNAENVIPSICAPLLEIREGVITMIHFTVKQYLEQYLEENQVVEEITSGYKFGPFQSGDKLAAAVCLTYLLLPAIGKLQQPSSHGAAVSIASSGTTVVSLLSYATLHWFEHLRLLPPSGVLIGGLVESFLNYDSLNMATWWRYYWFFGSDSDESAGCPSQFSPIHVAAYFDLHALIPTLATERASAALDNRQRTPLWWACSMGHELATAALLEVGFDPGSPDRDLITPAHRAAAGGHSKTFRHIVDSLPTRLGPLEKNIADSEGWTPLHWAAARGKIDIIELILDSRIKPNEYGNILSRTNSNRTPLHLAALNGHAMTIGILQNCFSLDAVDNHGSTALHLAALYGHSRTVEVLSAMRPKFSIRDAKGKTAAEKAKTMGYDETAIYLHDMENAVTFATSEAFEPISSNKRIESVKESPTAHEVRPLGGRYSSNTRDTQDSSLVESCANSHWRSLGLLVSKHRSWKGTDSYGRTALHHAIISGTYKQVASIIKRSTSDKMANVDPKKLINEADNRGWTALHYAAAGNFKAIAKLLLDAGASPDNMDMKGHTPLDIAFREGYQAVLDCMSRYSSLSTQELTVYFNWSDLHCAAREGSLPRIQQAIDHSEYLKEPDCSGRMPIHRAIDTRMRDVVRALATAMSLAPENIMDLAGYSRNETIVEILLEFLPSHEFQCTDYFKAKKRSLLLWAAEQGNKSITETLFKSGLKANVSTSEDVETILHIAIKMGHSSLADYLIETGADVSRVTKFGKSPLHYACEYGQLPALKTLLRHGADVNQRLWLTCPLGFNSRVDCGTPRLDGYTPLHFAMSRQTHAEKDTVLKVVACLLENRADVNLEDGDGHSPLWLAYTDPEILNIFKLHRPAVVQPVLEDGLTPFHVAASTGDTETVRLMLAAGLPVDWETIDRHSEKTEKTALWFAVQNGQVEVVTLLVDSGAELFYPRRILAWRPRERTYYVDDARKLGHSRMVELLDKAANLRTTHDMV